jgi:hypothetical protein
MVDWPLGGVVTTVATIYCTLENTFYLYSIKQGPMQTQVVSESYQNHYNGAVSNQLTYIGREDWVCCGASESIEGFQGYSVDLCIV